MIQTSGNAPVELSVWDFAGQHQYYHSHHHFLSARSVFLVLYNMTQGCQSLGFWLKSLKGHLPPSASTHPPKVMYSIIVVGTHRDLLSEQDKKKSGGRKAAVEMVFREVCNMGDYSFEYEEVGKNGEGIPDLRQKIVTAASSHSYMKELVPQIYLDVETALLELLEVREEKEPKDLPILGVGEAIRRLQGKVPEISEEKMMRALWLLHEWGVCLHFRDSEVLSEYLVLDPTFLTQDILGGLFKPAHPNLIRQGVLHHEELKTVWDEKYHNSAEFLLLLMEKFEVCFELEESGSGGPRKGFWERKSLVTGFLPDSPPSSMPWTEVASSGTTTEQRYVFVYNIIPLEILSRLLVRLHTKVEAQTLWKTGLYFRSSGVEVLMRATLEKNTLEIFVKGAESSLSNAITGVIIGELDGLLKFYPGVKNLRKPDPGTLKEGPSNWWVLSSTATHSRGRKESAGMSSSSDSLINGKDFRPLYPSGVGGREDGALVSKLKFAVESVGGSLDDITEARVIANRHSLQMFEGFRASLEAKKLLAPARFYRDWKVEQGEDSEDARKAKEEVIQYHEKNVKRYDWNRGKSVEVVLMAQGTTLEAAETIASTGFGIVGSAHDPGWFGRGIYTTSSLSYATGFAVQSRNTNPAIVISAVIPGNVLPVVDSVSYHGQAIRPGFQSHMTLGLIHIFCISLPLSLFFLIPNFLA